MIKDKKIHLIGVGGISMQGIAKTLVGANRVSGSDLEKSESTDSLVKIGVDVSIGHDENKIESDLDYVVKSNAIPENNPEVIKAKELKIPVLTNTAMIQLIINDKKIIAIAGTHGKSTTSAMASYILEKNGLKPTYYLGAVSNQLKGVAKYDQEGEFAVVEACEYKRAFLSYRPDVIVITNIEAEHLDYYKDLADIKKAYLEFIDNLREGGKLIVCRESKTAIEVAEASGKGYLSYGYGGEEPKINPNLDLKVFGSHNQLNGLAAVLATTSIAGNDRLTVTEAENVLEMFGGIRRRSEYLGRKGSIMVYDDYAHHPTEIKTTLKAFRDQFKNKKIFLVFQPHQLDRLNSFYQDFVSSLIIADKIVVLKAYQPPGRDHEEGKNSLDLLMSLNEASSQAHYADSYQQAAELCDDLAVSGDIIITMGAGPVFEVARIYLNNFIKD